jgi:hypothetical protein
VGVIETGVKEFKIEVKNGRQFFYDGDSSGVVNEVVRRNPDEKILRLY